MSDNDHVKDDPIDTLEPLDDEDSEIKQDLNTAKDMLHGLENPTEINDPQTVSEDDVKKLHQMLRKMPRNELINMFNQMSNQSFLSQTNHEFVHLSDKGVDDKKKRLKEKIANMRNQRMGKKQLEHKISKMSTKKEDPEKKEDDKMDTS